MPKKIRKSKKILPKKKKTTTRPTRPAQEQIFKTKIRVIGIGGGGSSIVSEIASEVKKVTFVVANTDSQALQEITKGVRRFQFGKSITQGLGTGMNPELGEQAAESDKEKIKELLKDYNPPATLPAKGWAPTDFCILVSCLGGGTGSGASPVFANILKNLGVLTLGIFTLPFEFEGEKRDQIAKDSLEKLRENLNALVIIPNQKIFQIIDASTSPASILSGNRRIDKNTPLKEALSTINKALIENLEGLITLIYSPGLIHIDFADLKTILAGKGRLAYLNSAEVPIPSAEGRATGQAKIPNQIEELAKKVVYSSLIPYTIQGAKEVLFNIDGGLNLNMSQVEQIGKTISNSISPQARVAFGITQNKKQGIKITLLANGCKWEEWEKKKEKPKERQSLITEIQDNNPPIASSHSLRERAPKPKKKVRKKTEKKPPELLRVQQPEITKISTDSNPPSPAKVSEGNLGGQATLPAKGGAPKPKKVKIQVRKNVLEVKESIEKEEKKMIAQERKWEIPAFLRRKPEE